MPDMPSSQDNATESLTVALAKLGNAEAFAKLVASHQSRIRGLLRHLSSDVTLADDLSQQAFLLAWRDIGKLRNPSAFSGWLKRIAINLWLKHLRTKDPLQDSVDDLLVSRAIRETTDVAIDLEQALSQLQETTRTCLVLSYVAGMSHGEIATTTKLPLGTVKSTIRRGTLELRALLTPYDKETEHV